MKNKYFAIIAALALAGFALSAPSAVFASGNTDVMSDGSKWSYGENVGWLNWNSTHAGVTVSTGYLVGYIWCENIGWVHLGTAPANGVAYANNSATDYGINRNQGTGVLSGYGWSENCGWLNFNPTHGGVSVSTAGIFGSTGTWVLNGWAWGENIGWLCFSSNTYRVRTYALPPKPTNVTGTALGISSIAWSWTDNSGGISQEAGFRIYNATSFALVGSVGQNVTGWDWTGLELGVEYSIFVQPYNLAWSSSTSNSDVAACQVVAPPSAPALNRAASGSPSQIIWSWQDNSSGAYQETGFKIYTATGGFIGEVGQNVTFYAESGLKRNKAYSRYVRAYNTAGSADSATVSWRAKPGAFQSKSAQGKPTRTGPNSFGFVGDASWEWDVPVKSGSALTITAYIRYNSGYGGAATKPKLTLSGKGISPTSVSATVSAENAWELRTLNAGTPSQNATLTLRAEGFSNTPGAEFYIDDINVVQ